MEAAGGVEDAGVGDLFGDLRDRELGFDWLQERSKRQKHLLGRLLPHPRLRLVLDLFHLQEYPLQYILELKFVFHVLYPGLKLSRVKLAHAFGHHFDQGEQTLVVAFQQLLLF